LLSCSPPMKLRLRKLDHIDEAVWQKAEMRAID
jgi:hypothetical protein